MIYSVKPRATPTRERSLNDNESLVKFVNSILTLVASAMLLFGQASKPAQKPDTWERSKECAAQAEKIMMGTSAVYSSWENHYSPKYNKCFVSRVTSYPATGAGKDFPAVKRELVDAFEKTTSAQWVSAYPGAEDPGDPVFTCRIDHGPAACAKAQAFISEHMKN